jgi:hypothetical protein
LHLDSLATLPTKEREAFARVKRNYDELLDALALPAVPASLLDTPTPATPEPEPDHDHDLDDPVAAQPQLPAQAAAAPTQPAARSPVSSNRSAIYLSDKELMATQSATDDGESEQ